MNNNNKSGVPKSKNVWRTLNENSRLKRKRRREEKQQEFEEQKQEAEEQKQDSEEQKKESEEQKQEAEEQNPKCYPDSDAEYEAEFEASWIECMSLIEPCLEKPELGHDAWRKYRNSLATKKEEEAVSSVYHDDDDEALGPKQKLKVREEEGGGCETSTEKEHMNRYTMQEIWLLMEKGFNPLKPQEAVKAFGEDKQIADTLG